MTTKKQTPIETKPAQEFVGRRKIKSISKTLVDNRVRVEYEVPEGDKGIYGHWELLHPEILELVKTPEASDDSTVQMKVVQYVSQRVLGVLLTYNLKELDLNQVLINVSGSVEQNAKVARQALFARAGEEFRDLDEITLGDYHEILTDHAATH